MPAENILLDLRCQGIASVPDGKCRISQHFLDRQLLHPRSRISESGVFRGVHVFAAFPPRGRRRPKQPLECSVEGGLRLITHLVRDLDDGIVTSAQALRRDLEALAGEIVHRRLANQPSEAVAERRAGKSDLACHVVHGPRFVKTLVDQRQCSADDGIS